MTGRDLAPRLMACTCEHEYQDSKYGKHVRVHNFQDKLQTWQCTVCGTKRG